MGIQLRWVERQVPFQWDGDVTLSQIEKILQVGETFMINKKPTVIWKDVPVNQE